MATGSVALIYTNARRGDMTTTGTTCDNLKLSFAGATEMPRNIIAHELLGNIFFAHELHEWTRRLCATGMATGSVARIGTNARRGDMTTTGTTWDNLKLSFADAIEIINEIFLPTNCTNGHEGYTLRIMATGSVARIVTNAMRVLLPLRIFLPLKTIHTRHWR